MGRQLGQDSSLHQMRLPVAGRKLHQAQPVALGIEAERFGVDGHQRPEIEAVRQIAFVQFDFHRVSSLRNPPAPSPWDILLCTNSTGLPNNIIMLSAERSLRVVRQRMIKAHIGPTSSTLAACKLTVSLGNGPAT